MLSHKGIFTAAFIFFVSCVGFVYSYNTHKNSIDRDRLYQKALDYYNRYDSEVGCVSSLEQARFHKGVYQYKFKAFNILKQLMKQYPDFALGYCLRARIWSKFCYEDLAKYHILSGEIEEKDFFARRDFMASANYNAALKCDHRFSPAYIGLFNLYSGSDTRRASKYLDKAILLNHPQAFWERGWKSFFAEDYAAAKKDMDRAISLDKKNRLYYKGRAEVEWYLKNYDAAIQDILSSGCIVDNLDSDINEQDYRKILKVCLDIAAPPVNSIEVVNPEEVKVDMGVYGIPFSSERRNVITLNYRYGEWFEKSGSRLESEY